MRRRLLLTFPATALAATALPAAAESPVMPHVSPLTPGIVANESQIRRTGIGAPRTAVTQREAMGAISDEVSVLSRLRDWRGTLGGTGKRASRQWTLASAGRQKLQLAIGAQQLPRFALAGLPASTAGTSARIGRVAVGTTWKLGELDELAAQYDGVMIGEAATTTHQTPWSWLSVRPVDGRAGNIDVLHARRSENGRDDLFTGARSTWNAPYRWKVDGEWSERQRDDSDARAWSLGAAGPLRHAWGEATATAQWKEVRPEFVSWDGAAVEAAETGSLAVQQGVAKGILSGTLQVSVGQTGPLGEVAAQGVALTQEAQSGADLRWKLSDSVAFITKHSVKSTAQRLKPADSTEAAAPTDGTGLVPGDEPSAGVSDAEREAWQIANEQSGDAGVEWKWSRSLAFTATAGQTRTARRLIAEALEPAPGFAPGRDERNRFAVGVQRRTAGGAWSLGLERQVQSTAPLASDSIDGSGMDTVQLAAERNLGPALRIKGTYGLSSNRSLAEQLLESRIARSLEAQWSLDMGRIDFRVGDSDNIRFAGAAPGRDDSSEWSARFNLGSANKGTGLGLAVEYAQRELAAETIPTWRIGLTYK